MAYDRPTDAEWERATIETHCRRADTLAVALAAMTGDRDEWKAKAEARQNARARDAEAALATMTRQRDGARAAAQDGHDEAKRLREMLKTEEASLATMTRERDDATRTARVLSESLIDALVTLTGEDPRTHGESLPEASARVQRELVAAKDEAGRARSERDSWERHAKTEIARLQAEVSRLTADLAAVRATPEPAAGPRAWGRVGMWTVSVDGVPLPVRLETMDGITGAWWRGLGPNGVRGFAALGLRRPATPEEAERFEAELARHTKPKRVCPHEDERGSTIADRTRWCFRCGTTVPTELAVTRAELHANPTAPLPAADTMTVVDERGEPTVVLTRQTEALAERCGAGSPMRCVLVNGHPTRHLDGKDRTWRNEPFDADPRRHVPCLVHRDVKPDNEPAPMTGADRFDPPSPARCRCSEMQTTCPACWRQMEAHAPLAVDQRWVFAPDGKEGAPRTDSTIVGIGPRGIAAHTVGDQDPVTRYRTWVSEAKFRAKHPRLRLPQELETQEAKT